MIENLLALSPFRRSLLPLLALSLLGSLLGGCAGAGLATLATVADITSGFSTGADVFRMGKLNSADLARYDEVLAAVRASARDMGLRTSEDKPGDKEKPVWKFVFRDELDSKIVVIVERRTARLVRIDINVGLFGSEPTAKLFMVRIRYHLPVDALLNPATTQAATPSTRFDASTQSLAPTSPNHADNGDMR